jgi:choline dehydrogenase-like flavoprotein
MALLDARRSAPERPLAVDLCIVGAGAAGITLAREFIGSGRRVVVLESGGLEYSPRVQQLYAGENVGVPSYALTYSRFRVFGGSTTRWPAQCRPLDPLDFEARPGIAHSGWPFDSRHLEAWYPRAQAVCGLSVGQDGGWLPDPGGLPLAGDELEAIVFRFGYPRDFGQTHRQEFERAAEIEVLLHANVVEIEPTPDLRSIRAVRAKVLEGREFEVEAAAYVLACGGIENARLLLASNRLAPSGVGNLHDLVGRFFMDHPYLTTGHFVPAAPRDADGPHVIRSFKHVGLEQKFHLGFALDQRIRRNEALTGCSAYFIRSLASEVLPEHFSPGGQARLRLAELLEHRVLAGAEVGRHLRRVAKGYREVALTLARRASEVISPRHLLAYRTILETTPRPDSRVTLGTARDRLGMPIVRVDWRISASDRRGLDRLRQAMVTAIESKGLGVLVEDPGVGDGGWPRSMAGGKHHMGTTRMHVDPKQGVVDPDGRVHGIANLYVAGSSVFPTGGYANPTFTIVALALRLADHLKSRPALASGTLAPP